MLTKGGNETGAESIFRTVSEGSWVAQAKHERFLFKNARAVDDPS